ncbi:hypothetical protein P9869_43105 [Streptomyces ossamyceticus]|nr:hypothetical protein [Streptomyces ossamyceticus]
MDATGLVGVGVLGPVAREGAPVGWGVDLWTVDLVPSGPAVMSRGPAGVAAGALDEVLGVTVDR